MKSVKKFSEEFLKKYNKIDIFIQNSGQLSFSYYKTKDGFEQSFSVNYLGHFYLTKLLLNVIKSSDNCRIVAVSSSLQSKIKKELDLNTINEEKNFPPKFPPFQLARTKFL